MRSPAYFLIKSKSSCLSVSLHDTGTAPLWRPITVVAQEYGKPKCSSMAVAIAASEARDLAGWNHPVLESHNQNWLSNAQTEQV